jgi:hypothetical protein
MTRPATTANKDGKLGRRRRLSFQPNYDFKGEKLKTENWKVKSSALILDIASLPNLGFALLTGE